MRILFGLHIFGVVLMYATACRPYQDQDDASTSVVFAVGGNERNFAPVEKNVARPEVRPASSKNSRASGNVYDGASKAPESNAGYDMDKREQGNVFKSAQKSPEAGKKAPTGFSQPSTEPANPQEVAVAVPETQQPTPEPAASASSFLVPKEVAERSQWQGWQAVPGEAGLESGYFLDPQTGDKRFFLRRAQRAADGSTRFIIGRDVGREVTGIATAEEIVFGPNGVSQQVHQRLPGGQRMSVRVPEGQTLQSTADQFQQLAAGSQGASVATNDGWLHFEPGANGALELRRPYGEPFSNDQASASIQALLQALVQPRGAQ